MIRVVTGYVELPDHFRGPDYYRPLGDKLMKCLDEIGVDYDAFDKDESPAALTYYRYNGLKPIRSLTQESGIKDTALYHICQYEKLELLKRSLISDKGAEREVYVWIDYSVFQHQDLTKEDIENWLMVVDNTKVVVSPGDIRLSAKPLHQHYVGRFDIAPFPDWYVLGSVLAVPRYDVMPMCIKQKWEVEDLATAHGLLTWEVNIWSSMARRMFPKPWNIYRASHDASMFSNLRG